MKTSNFTIADIKELEIMTDVSEMKAKVTELLTAESKHPIKPEKLTFFLNRINAMSSKLQIIKFMYDLLLSGEGFSVIGSTNSTESNSFRKKFK